MSRSFRAPGVLRVIPGGPTGSFDLVRVAFDSVIRILGWGLVFVGALWVGQGIGLIPGSFMTGSIFWALAGAVCVMGGSALVRWSRRKR
jgi:hypothetical protein